MQISNETFQCEQAAAPPQERRINWRWRNLFRFGEIDNSGYLPQSFEYRAVLFLLCTIITIDEPWILFAAILLALFAPVVGGKQEFVLQPIFDKIELVRTFIFEQIIERIIKAWLGFLCLCLIVLLAPMLIWICSIAWALVLYIKVLQRTDSYDLSRLLIKQLRRS